MEWICMMLPVIKSDTDYPGLLARSSAGGSVSTLMEDEVALPLVTGREKAES